MNQKNWKDKIASRKRYPKSIVVTNGRTDSASSTPRSSPQHSPMIESPIHESPKNSPNIRSVISTIGGSPVRSRERHGVKRKSTDQDPPKKRDKTKKKDSKKKAIRKSSENVNQTHKILKEIRREVNLDTPSSSRSPLANISQVEEPEHHTDNESDDQNCTTNPPLQEMQLIPLNIPQLGIPNNTERQTVFGESARRAKVDFHILASGKSSENGEEHQNESTTQGDLTEWIADKIDVKDLEDGTSDSLSELGSEDLAEDDMQQLSLQYLSRYSAGDSQWCTDYPEHGMPCRKCGMKGHTVINCTSAPAEKCVLCGQYDHHYNYCPETTELEYKKFVIPCFHCRQADHLGRNCPDHWRQFHRTTSSKFVPFDNTPNKKSPSCYNCAGAHYGHECTQTRIESHGPVLRPYVTKRLTEHQSQIFDNSSEKIRREQKGGKKTKRKRT